MCGITGRIRIRTLATTTSIWFMRRIQIIPTYTAPTDRTAMFEPFEYQFFVRGILAAVLVGGLCGMIGVYIVLKRMSYIGHGLSHAVLGGAVVSFVLSINFLVGATIWGFLCAQLIALTAKKRKIAADAAIGVITTASFALGIVLISRYKSFTRDFETALFGNILGVTVGDLMAIVVVTLATITVLFWPTSTFCSPPLTVRLHSSTAFPSAGWKLCFHWCWLPPSWCLCRYWECC